MSIKLSLALLAALPLCAQVSFVTGPNGLTSMTFGGVNYDYAYGEQFLTRVTTVTPTGSVAVSPTCTTAYTAASVTANCKTTGTDTVTVVATYSTPPGVPAVSLAPGATYGTVRADIQLTNNSASDTVSQALLSVLGVATTQSNAAASSPATINAVNPVSNGNYVTGQWAIWANTVSPSITLGITCGWSYICKNQPLLTNIGPGQTVTASFSIRFTTDATAQTVALAPEAYAAYDAAYPPLVNWPDRRPIMNWFIADTGHQSATNPRGYLWNPALDVSDIPAFTATALAQAQNILTLIQARPVQPQGIIVWDLEGEEFLQATTYVGDPRVFDEGYAPEMEATADQLFALFKNAGYKVGVTLRPQFLLWGTALPATCHYDPSTDYKGYFINVAAPFLQKFYGCYDPAGLAWSLVPRGNGGQTFFQPASDALEIKLLLAKATYANTRWGATLFYVDTTVLPGGAVLDPSIFRALQTALPNCLFIPEESNLGTMGVAMPYSEPTVVSDPKFSPVTWRYAYPTGGLGIYLSNCVGSASCWSANSASFTAGQMIGDIPIYSVPTQSSPAQLTTIESMIGAARTQASTITVTDSSTGNVYTYAGAPATIYNYPVKMRVYFASEGQTLNKSNLYCEAGGWTGTNSCTLNLSGVTLAQIQYYDFMDQLVSTAPMQPLQ
jgi:hypothetical protein